jgi:putative protease
MRNFAELSKAVALSHAHDVPVFFTINEHYYTRQQLPLVKEYIAQACDAGVDAFIIADYGLFHLLQELAPYAGIHISTGGTVFNWRTARFYGELGATRITLPRHLTLDEMARLTGRIAGLETTVFVFNSRCINVDGFCTFQHGLSGRQTPAFYRNACMLPYDITPIPLEETAGEKSTEDVLQYIARQRVWEQVHLDDYPCAACALYELQEMNITSIKIVGRGNTTERKTTDAAFFRTLVNRLSASRPAKKDFRKYARSLYNSTYRRPCRPFMCHYPSVME